MKALAVVAVLFLGGQLVTGVAIAVKLGDIQQTLTRLDGLEQAGPVGVTYEFWDTVPDPVD